MNYQLQLQKKDLSKDESLDFFKVQKIGNNYKKNFKKAVKVLNVLLFAQYVTLVGSVSSMYVHFQEEKIVLERTFDYYKEFNTSVERADYKNATYALSGLFAQKNSMSDILGLALVKNMALNEGKDPYTPKPPVSFVQETSEIAKSYHHQGINEQIKKHNEFKPCFTYDPGCNLLWNKFNEAITYSNNSQMKIIDEAYYNLTHLSEYKKYLEIPVEKRGNTLNPYEVFKGIKR